MNTNKFILSKPELDFFFKSKGNFKSLICGTLEYGIFKPRRKFEFDETGKIESETGYQSEWTAYPPGTIPPPAIQYLRKYTYKNGQLELVTEEDKKSKELLKSYEFIYHNGLISKITETKEGNKEYSSQHTTFEYDLNGFLSKQKIYISSIGEAKTYIISDIIRNANNQIVKILNSNSAEHKGKLVLEGEISTYNIEYEGNKIIKSYSSPNHDKTYTITANLLASSLDIIETIQYPVEFDGKQKVEYEYDEYNQNIKKKRISYKDREVTKIYIYE